MKFDPAIQTNPIDRLAVVGRSIDRVDGPLKVTGRALYAYEQRPSEAAAYGYPLFAGIARGRIRGIDTAAAMACQGVLTIVTHETVGDLGKGAFNNARLLGGPEITHYHQAIGVVVAETFEQARAAAQAVVFDIEPEAGRFDLNVEAAHAIRPARIPGGDPPDAETGDFATAYAASDVTIDVTYHTSDHSHAMMEPHASIAAWDGDRLTLWTATQSVDWVRSDLAKTLGMSKEQVTIVSPFTGGGFGGKAFLRADALLAALAAQAAGRPVKVALPRAAMFNNTQRRPATIQRIRLGASRSGRIEAIAHETWSGDQNAARAEAGSLPTRLLYAGENRLMTTRVAALDLVEAGPMRAPGEAPGSMAIEAAMDEMAEKLGLDPIAFRLMNDTDVVPGEPHRRFSSRKLAECFRIGAARFGWEQRRPLPLQRCEGGLWIGMGVAAAFRNNVLTKAAARVRLAGGRLTVETDMTDIGTGTYTILAQTAAEMLGLEMADVTVRLGHSDFPVSPGSVGQLGANNSAASVYAACVKLREAIAQKLGFNSQEARFENGHVIAGNRRMLLAAACGDEPIEAEDVIEYGDDSRTHQQSTFGAQFVEVAVDTITAEVRVRRMLAVCSAGRILNRKLARSQVIGAMTMGLGAALMEELALDRTHGCFVNHDLAGYEVPVHADVPALDVIFLEETDPLSSPMKAKGVGELGMTGVGAAIANGIYNAVGVRVRDYPIKSDTLIEALSPLASP